MSVTPMCLGPYMFHATRFGYSKFGRSVTTNWAEIEVVGGMNIAQWTGGQSEKITINGVLFPEEFGGLNTMKALQLAQRSAVILPLVTLGGKVFGNFRIESVEEDQTYHDRFGNPRKNDFSISLTQHRGPPTPGLSIVNTLFG